MFGRQYETDKNIYKREKNWNQRFVLEKIPKFDAYKDINYVSLGLLKSKIRYEERIKIEEAKSKYAGRIYSAHYMRPKSSSKIPKENYLYYNTLTLNNKKKRNPSMRIAINPNLDFKNKINRHKTLNDFHYQGVLTSQNFAGSHLFNYNPDYKNRNININIRNIICEEDPEIAEEYELVRELWEKLGVTENYIGNFDFILNGKSNNRDSILELIIGEKKQMKKFRLELMKVISEINKRENKINDLKEFIKTYKQINKLIQIKNNKDKNIEEENNKENKEIIKPKNIGEINKELLESDIHDCLKSLRLRTINAVNIIKKFKTTYSHLFYHKINLEFIKSKYGYDDKYLNKLKNDLDFLKDSAINELYHFSEKGGDPFLLCISDKCGNPADVPRYRQLPISNEILQVVKSFRFSLEQEEVFTMIKNKNKQNQSRESKISYKFNNYNNYDNNNNFGYYNETNNNYNYNNQNNNMNEYNFNIHNNYNTNLQLYDKNQTNLNNLSNNYKSPVNENLISANFKGNVENEKLKLKAQNEYKNVFFNTEDNYDKFQNQNIDKQELPKEEKKYELPGMTSKQLYRHLAKYTKIKRELFPPFNKDIIKEEVQKSIIQKIEDRINKVEKDFKSKMDEKFQKEEKKLKEEEKRIQNEKERIEKMRIEEEKERKKKEEKYFKFENERNKRRNKDKKKKEENERFTKRENDIFLREMQMKFMKEVDERFKKENERQIELKKEEINDAEEKEKRRKEEIERIRNDDYEKIKRGDVLVDLRSEGERIKTDNDVISPTNQNNEKSDSESNDKEENENSENNNETNKKESESNKNESSSGKSKKNNTSRDEKKERESESKKIKSSDNNESDKEEEEDNNDEDKSNEEISEEISDK